MLMDAYDHAMPRLNACLTPMVLQPFPPNRNLVPRLHDLPFLVETRINLTKIVLTFPRSVLLTMIIPNHLVDLMTLLWVTLSISSSTLIGLSS